MIFINIGGAPSSGTTLFADLLDGAPMVACGPELYMYSCDEAYNFSPDFKYAVIRRKKFKPRACHFAPRPFFNRRNFCWVGLNIASFSAMVLASSGLVDFSNRLAKSYSHYRKKETKVFCEKTPINVNLATKWCDNFTENGIFVHVVRDGRDVVASLMRRNYTLYEAALIWLSQTYDGCLARGRTNYREVSYERIVEQPFKQVTEVLDAAGHSISDADAQKGFNQNTYRQGLPRVASWRVVSSAEVVKPQERYSSRLSSDQIALLEALELERRNPDGSIATWGFAEALSALGYPLTGQAHTASEDLFAKERALCDTKNGFVAHQTTSRLRLVGRRYDCLSDHHDLQPG